MVAGLGFLTVWALWPLIWLGLSFGSLRTQETDAAPLLWAAPGAFLSGLVRVSGAPHQIDGRYLLRSEDNLDRKLRSAGWTFVDQMGASRFYHQSEARLTTTCRQFSRYFSVCNAVTKD